MEKQFNERKCLFVISFTLLGSVFLFSSSAAAVDLQADQRSVANARSTWQRTVETISSRIQTCKNYEANIKYWEQRIPQLRQEISSKQSERDIIYDELMRGLYCSQCGRSATQLGGMAKFQDHLHEVKGVQKRLSPQEIAQKIAPYDKELEALKREYGEIEPKYDVQKAAREACSGELWQLGIQLLNEGRSEEWWRNRYWDDTITDSHEKMNEVERAVERANQDYQSAANNQFYSQSSVNTYRGMLDSWLQKVTPTLNQAQCQHQLHQSDFNDFVSAFQAALARLRTEIQVLNEDPAYGTDSHLVNGFDCPIFMLSSNPVFQLSPSVLAILKTQGSSTNTSYSSPSGSNSVHGAPTSCPAPSKAPSGRPRIKFR